MTVREILCLLDHEVWVRVRPRGEVRDKPDVVFFSADWHMDSYLPKRLEKYLDWDGDDMYVDMYKDPEDRSRKVPMLVICAQDFPQDPTRVYVFEKITDRDGPGLATTECRTFLKLEHAQTAMRDDYDAEIDSADAEPDYDGSHLGLREAVLRFPDGSRIDWIIHTQDTEDADYRGR